MRKYIYFIIFSNALFSQTITFEIKDNLKNPIDNVNVLFSENDTNTILEYIKITPNSKPYTLKRKYQNLRIDIQSYGYQSDFVILQNITKDSVYPIDRMLIIKKINELDEIVIKSENKKVLVKRDTVVYLVSKFTDGTEKKVEDLLRKLPGITVENGGIITYKGKPLETVTLDGDNIFNSNYQVGTKNINIGMVEQVEAIDNYTNNRLLRGIESDGKVSLNLKIKKGKSDFSGESESSLGLKNDQKIATYFNFYLMQIAAKNKSFLTMNHNNIGRSDSYFYEKQNSKSLDKKAETDFRTKKVIPEELFSPNIDPVRFNQNNQFFASYNTLLKINKSINLKINLNFIDDKIKTTQNISTKIFDKTSNFETNDMFEYQKKLNVITAEVELKYNTTNSSMLEIYSKQYFEKSSLSTKYTKNNEVGFVNTNTTNDYFSLNKIVHTYKVNKYSALQGNLYFAYNNIPQIFISNSELQNLEQRSTFQKSTLAANYNLIGKYKNIQYSSQIGTNISKTPYKSQSVLVSNNTIFKNNTFFNHSRIKIDLGKVDFIPSLSITDYDLQLTNSNQIIETHKTVVEPSFSFVWKMDGKSTLNTYITNTIKPIDEENIFVENVFLNNRTTIFNNPTFDFQNRNSIFLGYNYNDFNKSKTLEGSIKFENSNGVYLQDIVVNENFTSIKNGFFFEKNEKFDANAKVSQFIKNWLSTFTISSVYTYSKYPNLFNNSDIRLNTNQMFKNKIEFRTGFNRKLNIEQVFTHNTMIAKSFSSSQIQSIENSSKLKYKINKKSNCHLKIDLFLPDLNKKSNYYAFLDFEYNYKFSKNINFVVIGNNILNINSFSQVENNDFSIFISDINLTPRLFLVCANYRF